MTSRAPKARPWNPYFVAYAHSQGRSPADQQAYDKEKYPGGSGTGFVLWMAAQRVAFRRASPDSFFRNCDGQVTHTILDHKAWAAWLAQHVRPDLAQ